MIFLQKSKKTHKKFKNDHEDFNVVEEIEKMTFPQDSVEITFNMFDIYKNKTIHVLDWYLFLTVSFNYMKLTPMGVQRLNWDVLNANDLSTSEFDVF